MKLIVAALLLVLIPIFCLGVYAYKKFEQALSDQIVGSTSQKLRQVNRNLELEFQSMLNASSSILLDNAVLNILKNPPQSLPVRLSNAYQIDRKFVDILSTSIGDTAFLTLIDSDRNLYTNWVQSREAAERIFDASWYQQAIENSGLMVWELNHDNYIYPNGQNMITLTVQVKDTILNESLGTLMISRPADHFLGILRMKDRQLGNQAFIMDGNGNVLSNDILGMQDAEIFIEHSLDRGSTMFNSRLQGEDVQVFMAHIRLTDWQVIQIIPKKQIFRQINYIRNIAVAVFIICITVFISVVVVISTMITGSLRKLKAAIKQVESGNFNVNIDIPVKDEVSWISRNFNRMVIKLKAHIENEIVLERKKKQAQLDALQAQIHPHFLYNTINTIKWMSILAGVKSITEMLIALGHLLNTSIHLGKQAVSLEEEMVNARHYLTLQRYSFGDILEIKEALSEDSLNCVVPKLCLQPLIENIYQHGLFHDKGIIIIHSRVESGLLHVEVTDNGLGPGAEKLKEISLSLDESRNAALSGIGLKTVHKRLRMMFGTSYGLTIERDDKHGLTRVSMRLPARSDWHDDQDHRNR